MKSNGFSVARFDGDSHEQRVFSLQGPLTLEAVPSLQAALHSERAPTVILDLAEVPYIDSAGLGSIMATYISQQKAGHRVVLSGVNKRVLKLFEITGVEPLFLMFPTLDGAMEALATAANA